MSDALKQIASLAKLMTQQIIEVEAAEIALSEKKAALLRTKREDLPELMREIGLAQVILESGEIVTVSDDVTASIPAIHRARAIAWLTERGYDGIIKTNVSIEYTRGEHDAAMSDAAAIAETLGRNAAVNENIHPQTLRAFIRERMAAGETVPFDLFGIHPYSEAKVKYRK